MRAANVPARVCLLVCVQCSVRWARVKGQERLDAPSSQVHEDDRLVSVDGVVVRGMTPQEVLSSFFTPRLTYCEHKDLCIKQGGCYRHNQH